MDEPLDTLAPYRQSLAGTLLAAREAVMAPIRPMLREAGVTEQQWRVLRVLNDTGPLDPTSLAHAALLYAPSVTRIIKDLSDRGFVTREIDANDRRRAIVALAPIGAALLRDTARHTAATLADYRKRFGAKRLDALMAELRLFSATISEGR